MRGQMKFLALAAAVSALLVIAVPAGAITGGQLDNGAHPNVGLLVIGGRPACSGVLVAPTVFVTAGHCGRNGARVAVTFDTTIDGDEAFVPGRLFVDPEFGLDKTDTHDIAVVVLDQPVSITPALLPAAGAFESVTSKTELAGVGYGVHEVSNGGGTKRLAFDGERRFGALGLKALKGAEASVAPVTAGLCFGDSGGPLLLGETVMSLTSHGNKVCEGNIRTYRLDTPSARSFLSQFVAVP